MQYDDRGLCARAGLIAPDKKTIEYFKDRPMSPQRR